MPRLDLLRRFGGSTDGNVAMLFAFMSLPLLALGGAAIDYGFATRTTTNLQAATDATSLALCQTPQATTAAQLRDKAVTMMQGYIGPSVTLDPLGITSNPRQITLTARVASAVIFGKLTGTTAIQPQATARCATPMPRTFEIALVLDNTGSMDKSGGSGTKMDALKTAAKNFVTFVYDNESFANDTRISLVPFAASVAMPTSYRTASWIDRTGKSRYHMQNISTGSSAPFTNRMQIFDKLKAVRSNWAWAGCLETLPYPRNVQDGSPDPAVNDSYFVPMFAPDEPGNGTAEMATIETSPGSKRYYGSVNSYLTDSTSDSNCGSTNAPYMDRLERACKYSKPNGVVSTNQNAAGVPNGPNFGCTTQPLMTLTSDATALNNAITNLNASGSTNTHEGLMWGWRTLSPVSVFNTESKPPSAYTADTVNKIMILMTDGANMWPVPNIAPTRSMYTSSGYILNADDSNANSRLPPSDQNITNAADARDALDALTAQACSNAKSTGIAIYTIGFSTDSDPIDAQGLKLLENCASSSGQFYLANDSGALINAFNEIAASLGKLRLTL